MAQDCGRRGEEQSLGFPLFVDPPQTLAEEQIRAVTLSLLEFSIVHECGILVHVAGRVAAGPGIRLPDAAAAVNIHLVEAALDGLIRGGIAEMPLPEDTSLCSRPISAPGRAVRVGEHVGLTLEVGEADALTVQAIHIRGHDKLIAMAGDVAVSLIIGEDENDVRPFVRQGGASVTERKRAGAN